MKDLKINKALLLRDVSLALLYLGALVLIFYNQLFSYILIALSIVGIIEIRKIKVSIIEVLSLCFFIWMLVGVIYTHPDHLNSALSILEKNLTWCILPLSLIIIKSFSLNSRNAVLSYFIGVCVVSAIFLNVFAFFYKDIFTNIFRYSYFTVVLGHHPVYLAIAYIFALSFLLDDLIRVKKQFFHSSLLKAIFSFILIFIIIQINSRMGIITLVIICIYFFTIAALLHRKYLKYILALALIVFTALFFTINNNIYYKYRLFTKFESSLNSRIELASYSFNLIRDNFLLGVGTGDGEYEIIKQYEIANFQYGLENNYTTHNQYISILIKHGVIGLILFLAFLFYIIRQQYILKNPLNILHIGVFLLAFMSELIFGRFEGISLFTFIILFTTQWEKEYLS